MLTLSIITLLAGGIMSIYGALKSTHRPFQDWLYRKEKGLSADFNSREYTDLRASYAVNGSRIGLIGALVVIFALASLGLLDR